MPCGSTVVGSGGDAVVRASSPRIGTLEAVNSYGRTGEHRVDGSLISAGPGLQPAVEESVISILDVAPTITAVLGVPFPSAEGRAIADMMPNHSPLNARKPVLD